MRYAANSINEPVKTSIVDSLKTEVLLVQHKQKWPPNWQPLCFKSESKLNGKG
ncbi:hypothetical protein VCHA51O448_40418 [Vibrio chagasii]|nr:hypothetical protein VCHA35O143_10411 [Vibrio chagasii]CAH6875005.1 hypothetical protein VCHA36O163_20036 [Vibrio chagasii]CAH6900445.1 hypothetical protein VCHA31O71_20593 [Vibrio chagasii]CAH7115949.1 hypothetical protein VCHA50O409_30034 [Vibrio chagasii]CAH7193227.1 hypothetical protein VCHA40O231_30039 [Vibrio chagasii]